MTFFSEFSHFISFKTVIKSNINNTISENIYSILFVASFFSFRKYIHLICSYQLVFIRCWGFGFDFGIFEFHAWFACEFRTAIREWCGFVCSVCVQFAAIVCNWQWSAVFDQLKKSEKIQIAVSPSTRNANY